MRDTNNFPSAPLPLCSSAPYLYQPSNLEVRVERVNKPPTPLQFRLLCKMSVDAIDDFRPFSSRQYQPFIAEMTAVILISNIGTKRAISPAVVHIIDGVKD
jgi:hypothetical protein